MKILLSFLLTLSTSAVMAASAQRLAGEDFRDVARKHLGFNRTRAVGQLPSAYSAAVSFGKLNFNKVPQWKDTATLNKNFKYVRNLAFLTDPDGGQLKRRSSWFYPDDGCWLRAQLMNANLKKKGIKQAAKIFIFGNLNVMTKYSPSGQVGWWYHVVPLIRVGSQAYALDPAINGGAPLPVKSWALRQVKNLKNATYAICHPNTFGPGDTCATAYAQDTEDVMSSQQDYLTAEKERLQDLGLDPNKFLGKIAPWK